MDRFGEFGEGGFGPVVGELVVVALAEVVGGGVGEEGLREVEADAEAAGVHRRFQQRFGGRACVLVAGEEFGGTGQVLGDPPVGVGAGEGVGQQPVTALGESSRCGLGRSVKGIRDADAHSAAGEQFSCPTVRILPAGGQCHVLACVFGPERAQYEDRPALRTDQ
ncbi:hypothetical protein [Streptomyces sp. NPDC008240]|uniref:hypothetical protein n=1 Tax=Streptomyces sp. NPDC008240 TaxID=3364822 RepID=UPI0036E0DC82